MRLIAIDAVASLDEGERMRACVLGSGGLRWTISEDLAEFPTVLTREDPEDQNCVTSHDGTTTCVDSDPSNLER